MALIKTGKSPWWQYEYRPDVWFRTQLCRFCVDQLTFPVWIPPQLFCLTFTLKSLTSFYLHSWFWQPADQQRKQQALTVSHTYKGRHTCDSLVSSTPAASKRGTKGAGGRVLQTIKRSSFKRLHCRCMCHIIRKITTYHVKKWQPCLNKKRTGVTFEAVAIITIFSVELKMMTGDYQLMIAAV